MQRFFAIALLAAVAALAPAVPAQAKTTTTMPSCAAGDPVVWVNTKTKVYHMEGDSYYGNTKSGKYACKSAADSSGAHAAKSAGSTKSAKAAMTPAPDASPEKKSKKHHKKSSSATPDPAAS